MEISLISCVDDNLSIGNDGKLLFYSREDMDWFKQHTHGKPCIIGRTTYESIGKKLKNRINIVLTRDKNYKPKNKDVLVRHSIESILAEFKNEKELMVLGGSEIYRQFLSIANRLYITRVHYAFENTDSYFPRFSTEEFKEYYFKESKENSLATVTYHVYKKS